MRGKKRKGGSLRKIKRRALRGHIEVRKGKGGREVSQGVGIGKKEGSIKRRRSGKRSAVVEVGVLRNIVGTKVGVRAGRATGGGGMEVTAQVRREDPGEDIAEIDLDPRVGIDQGAEIERDQEIDIEVDLEVGRAVDLGIGNEVETEVMTAGQGTATAVGLGGGTIVEVLEMVVRIVEWAEVADDVLTHAAVAEVVAGTMDARRTGIFLGHALYQEHPRDPRSVAAHGHVVPLSHSPRNGREDPGRHRRQVKVLA